MSEIRFHILDSYIQDLEIENETDTTQEVRYVDDEFSDTQDAEVYSRRKRGKSATYSSKKRSIVIHIFGTLANGDSAHLSVYGFEPFFYVKMPNHLTEVKRPSLNI